MNSLRDSAYCNCNEPDWDGYGSEWHCMNCDKPVAVKDVPLGADFYGDEPSEEDLERIDRSFDEYRVTPKYSDEPKTVSQGASNGKRYYPRGAEYAQAFIMIVSYHMSRTDRALGADVSDSTLSGKWMPSVDWGLIVERPVTASELADAYPQKSKGWWKQALDGLCRSDILSKSEKFDGEEVGYCFNLQNEPLNHVLSKGVYSESI